MARFAWRAGSAPTTASGRAGAARQLGLILGLMLVTGAVLASGPPAAAQSEADVVPIVECSFLDAGTGMYNTVWGYQNVTKGQKQETVVPIGPTNRFDDPGEAAGQPIDFKPGRAQNAFVVTHRGSSTWTLTGRSATAPGPACSTNPVPIAASSWAGLVTIAAVTLLLGSVLWWRMRRARRL